MSTGYESDLRKADLPGLLDAIDGLLGRLSQSQIEDLGEKKPDQVERIEALTLALRPRIAATDPLLVSEEVLASMREPLNQIKNGLQGYLENESADSLNGIRSWTDRLAGAIAMWPIPADLPSSDAREIAARFRRSAAQHVNALSGEFEKAKEELSDLQSSVQARSDEWQAEKAGLQEQLSDLSSTIEKQQGRLDEALDRYQGQFSAAQDRRGEQFQGELAELQEWAAGAKSTMERQLDQVGTTAEDKSRQLTEQLEAELAKARGITGVIGSTGTAAGYQEEADAQRRTANMLRYGAILLGLAAAGLAVWAIIHTERSSEPSLTVVFSKALGSLVFAGLAGYVATQSAHHRHREEQARRRQLDLLALPPFIAALPDGQKEEITGEVASKTLLPATLGQDGPEEAALTKESISLIGLLLEAIRRG